MIEKPFTGIIALMDEEVRMPKGSDETLLQKLVHKHKPFPEFEVRSEAQEALFISE